MLPKKKKRAQFQIYLQEFTDTDAEPVWTDERDTDHVT